MQLFISENSAYTTRSCEACDMAHTRNRVAHPGVASLRLPSGVNVDSWSLGAVRLGRANTAGVEGPTDPPKSRLDRPHKKVHETHAPTLLAEGRNVSSCRRSRRIDAHRKGVQFGSVMQRGSFANALTLVPGQALLWSPQGHDVTIGMQKDT